VLIRKGKLHHIQPLTIYLGLCIVWLILDIFTVLANSESWLLFLDGMSNTASLLALGAFSLFLYQYLTQGKKTTTFFYILIGATTFFLILRLTNPLHHLYYQQINFVKIGPALQILPIFGPFYSVHTIIYALILTFAIFFMVARKAVYQRILQTQLTLTLYALAGFLVYEMLLSLNLRLIRLPVLSFVGTLPGLLFCLYTIQNNLLNLQPVATENPLEEIKDGILTISGEGIVVDLNNRMSHIIKKTWKKAAGSALTDVFPELYAKLEETGLFPTNHHDSRRLISHSVFEYQNAHYDTLIYFTNRYIKVTMHDVTNLVNDFQTNRNLAAHDPLTGIFNRRQGEQSIKERLQNEEFGDVPYCFVVFDIDYFKQINDQYGHQTGDLILKEITEVFTSSIRPADIFGRYGGDEFILLLHMVNPDQAETILERIQSTIRSHPFLSEDGQVVRPTISIGAITATTAANLPYSDIFFMADEALYQAKEKGRNQVVVRHHTPLKKITYL
jgi:diguanylate cyclase (GGDEF)-like protein